MPTLELSPSNKDRIKEASIKVGFPAIRYLALTGCILVVLKALGKITMPWWQVLLPFYWWVVLLIAGTAISAVIIGFVLLGCWIIDSYDRYRRRRIRKQRVGTL